MKRQPRYSKGQRIGGRFLVHQALMGGMGEVYLCLDTEDNAPYALKTFQESRLDTIQYFEQEVAHWIALEKHPNIVRCFLMARLDSIPFMVLEWVVGDELHGTDLRSWLRHGPLDPKLALKFAIDILHGLQYANEKHPGIVHRDLKPDNVLVTQGRQAKITDFGLATLAQRTGIAANPTDFSPDVMYRSISVGGVVGTPHYMPPEQWLNSTELSFRTDIYSVGCILFELLTGRVPFEGRTIGDLRTQHLEAPIPSLNSVFHPALQRILNRCMAKRAADRYTQLDLLLEDIKEAYTLFRGEPLAAIRIDSFTADDHNDRGTTYAELRQYERALSDFNQAIHLDPMLAGAYSNRAMIYRELKMYEQALLDLNKAISMDPNCATFLNNRGLVNGSLGYFDQAITDFDRAIYLEPDYAKAFNNRGNLRNNLKQYEKAISDLANAINLDPSYSKAYNNRGNAHVGLEDFESAVKDYNYAISLDPTYVKAYYNRGTTWLEMGEAERASADFEQVILLDSGFTPAYFNRGIALANLGRLEEALFCFEEADRLGLSSAATAAQELRQQLKQRHLPQVRKGEEKTTRSDAKACHERGYNHMRNNDIPRAIAEFDAATRIQPDFAEAYSDRATCYGVIGQTEQAIKDYNRAISIRPNWDVPYTGRGMALLQEGKLDEAQQSFEKAKALGNSEAAGNIDQVKQLRHMTELYSKHGPSALGQFLERNNVHKAERLTIVLIVERAHQHNQKRGFFGRLFGTKRR